jgi:hypothetical protein
MANSNRHKACDCRSLSDAADDPDIPIEFDPGLNEFHIMHRSPGGYMPVYFCPFCGGRAPKSQRDRLFARVSDQEQARLFALTSELTSLPAVLAALGPPNHDDPKGLTTQDRDTEERAGLIRAFRTLVYTNLSETADVHVVVKSDGRVWFDLQGKYIGSPRG